MAEGFICSRFRRPTESCPVVEQQQQQPVTRFGQQTPNNRQQSQDYELSRPQETGSEKRTLNIRLLSEAISSLVLLPESCLQRAVHQWDRLNPHHDDGSASESNATAGQSHLDDARLAAEMTDKSIAEPESLFLHSCWNATNHLPEIQRRQFLERMGEAFLLAVLDEYCGALQSLGSDLFGFLQNLGSVYQEMKTTSSGNRTSSSSSSNDEGNIIISNHYDISFSCVPEQGRLTLHFRTALAACGYLWAGVLKGIATHLFHVGVTIRVTIYELKSKSALRYHFCFSMPFVDEDEVLARSAAITEDEEQVLLSKTRSLICFDDPSAMASSVTDDQPTRPFQRAPHLSDLKQRDSLNLRSFESTTTSVSTSTCMSQNYIGTSTFCRAFPWHFMVDRHLQLVQLGVGFMRLFGAELKKMGRHLATYFQMKKPTVEPNFDKILKKANSPFILAVCHVTKDSRKTKLEGLEFKGQMLYCHESDCLLFLASPLVDGLEALTSRGLFISDIPIHDATRDIVLIGEQARAQDGMKRRLDKLKKNIEEATVAVEQEREKNVSLLHLIFPPDIAKRLWLGESIEAQSHDNVTMLFSDLVGFTAICSTATPMEIISLLQSLYTQFDVLCGDLDIYKVETIGDAYCAAGGLHRASSTHAQQIAWMALCMLEVCRFHQTHDGQPIQMRIGLHTGTVLAGVVGRKMPRYCLFGNNVTLANKFESTSVPFRTNISPSTYELIKETPIFETEARPRDCLPKNFPADIVGTCHFLNGYRHPDYHPPKDVEPGESLLRQHIRFAVKQLRIGCANAL